MYTCVRAVLVIGGLSIFVLAYMFLNKIGWVNEFWAWDDKKLSFVFIASMQAAIAAGMFWIGLSGKMAGLAAGGLNLTVMMGGLAISIFGGLARIEQYGSLALALFCLLFAIINVLLFLWARRLPIEDTRPMPPLARYSFMLFIVVLLSIGIVLLSVGIMYPQNAKISFFPWDLPFPTAIFFGWMFLGDAFYFGYALYRNYWTLACVPLLSFLAYDLVLIQPFIQRLMQEELPPLRQLSLIVYIGVLIYSGLLAIYYLFINPQTRLWRPAPLLRKSLSEGL